MDATNKIGETEKNKAIDDLFQEAMTRLKKFHEEKLELIKKYRLENNLEELNKIRKSLKE